MTKTRVLFLCTHNSARSQMAEGLLRHLAGDRFDAVSAGTEATFVRPEAIKAMAEVGMDISGQESETLERYLGEPFDYVITVCDDANEACPVFPGAKNRLHWSLRDPSRAEGSEAERLAAYREVRDGILDRINDELLRRQPETQVSIGPARPDELPRIFELLEESGLPHDGLEDHLSTILVARHDGRIVGSAALELYAPAALLRSVAVSRDLRGSGLGSRLTGAALDLSRSLGVEEAYLLTETADLFFPRFGFREIPRSEVPSSVRRSVEFTSACPESARAMMLDLRAV